MPFVRRALATVAFTAFAVTPGATAFATSDTPDMVRGLATDGAHLVAEESELLDAASNPALSVTELAEARSSLRTVDAQATAIMQQLDLLGVDLSNAIRAVMAPLPTPGSSSAEMQPPLPPPTIVYNAAIADLMRIAATPAALTPMTKNADSGGTSFGLLAVAAAALLALGLAALANTLRRTDDDDDLAAMAWSDGLTGVANRRRLDRDIAVHTGAAGPTAVIMVDVDHFKQVNDTYGHQVGDDVLRAVGAALATHVRTRRRRVPLRRRGVLRSAARRFPKRGAGRRRSRGQRNAVDPAPRRTTHHRLGRCRRRSARATWRAHSRPPTAPCTRPRPAAAIAPLARSSRSEPTLTRRAAPSPR